MNSTNIKTFYQGQVIFREEQESGIAYMIRKGSVNIYKVMNNKKVILDHLGEGEIFGEMGVINPGRRTANAEAAEFCELLVLTNQVLYGLLKQCPKTIQFLTKALIRRLKRTTAMIPEGTHQSTFLSICRLLEMAWSVHSLLPPEERKKDPNHDLGLNYFQFVRKVKSIILVAEMEIDAALERLAKLKVVEINSLRSAKITFPERFIKIMDPATFAEVCLNLYKELQRSDFTLRVEMEHLDVYDFAEAVGTTPQLLYQKMAAGEIPEGLFFFHRSRGLDWAAKQDKDFFRSVARKRKKPEELRDIVDVLYVDNATLKTAFERLGYYKLGVLVALAPTDEVRERILGNLARKIAQVVEGEARSKEAVDDAEAADVVEELFETVREIKGANAGKGGGTK